MIHAIRNIHFHNSAMERVLLVKRRGPLWLRTGLVFVHVPKAAGTSISDALYGRFTGHVRALDVVRWGSFAVRSLPRVAVVRNPWARLVSAYRFVKRGAGIGGPHAGRVWHPEQYRVPEFETFERFVNDWLAGRDLRKLDISFHPQSDFVCNERGQVIVHHLGRFENLDETHAYLRATVARLPAIGDSNRSGEAVDYRTFYTPDLVDLVGQIYADDIRLLGYSFDGP
jgi:chondroitin 4-sulfotransferase 11